jgi:hypothetical protein
LAAVNNAFESKNAPEVERFENILLIYFLSLSACETALMQIEKNFSS